MRRCKGHKLDLWVEEIPWRRKWQPTLIFLPGKSHGQRILVGYSSQGDKESDTAEHTDTTGHRHKHTHTTHTHTHTHTHAPGKKNKSRNEEMTHWKRIRRQ